MYRGCRCRTARLDTPATRWSRVRATNGHALATSSRAIPSAVDNHVLKRGTEGRGVVGILFERDQLTSTITPVSGDQNLGFTILDPADSAPALKPPKITVCGANPGAGQQCNHQFGNQRHVHGHDVAAAHTQAFEHIGEF